MDNFVFSSSEQGYHKAKESIECGMDVMEIFVAHSRAFSRGNGQLKIRAGWFLRKKMKRKSTCDKYNLLVLSH